MADINTTEAIADIGTGFEGDFVGTLNTGAIANADVTGINNSQLSFEDLALVPTGNDTLIRGLNTDLAIVEGIEPSALNGDDFFFA